MNRRVAALDRVVVGVIGLLLLAGGVLVTLFALRRLPGAPTSVDASSAGSWPDASWWPWATAGAALVLLVLGLWWLLAHTRRGGPTQLTLRGSSAAGRLGYDLGATASAASQVLAASPDVTGTRSGVVWEGGRPLVEVRATVSPRARLEDVDASVRAVAGQLATVTDGEVPLRVRVAVARRRGGSRPLR